MAALLCFYAFSVLWSGLHFIKIDLLSHLPYYPIMIPDLPRDLVIIIRYQIIQQPDFRHHEPWVALDGTQAALGAPAADGMGGAGKAGYLLHGEYVGGIGQLLLQVVAEVGTMSVLAIL